MIVLIWKMFRCIADWIRVHVVNIVTLADGSKYHMDVGFGGDGATKPLPLIDGHVTQNLGSQEVRLVHGNIPDQTDLSQKLWIYQYRNGPEKDWNSFYAFPELQFIAQDFHIMNWYTSKHPESFQTFTVLIVRYLRKEGEDRISGKVMLINGVVKQNLGGKTEVVMECKSEEQRIEALKKYFEITLTEEEKNGVLGTVTELK
jgi:arylamine N-acetyltransferase